jgi:hypothetical protein
MGLRLSKSFSKLFALPPVNPAETVLPIRHQPTTELKHLWITVGQLSLTKPEPQGPDAFRWSHKSGCFRPEIGWLSPSDHLTLAQQETFRRLRFVGQHQ